MSLGELLDRAIALCVRSFAAFTIIIALVDIPLNLLEFALDRASPDRLSDIVTTLRDIAGAIPSRPPDGAAHAARAAVVTLPDMRLVTVALVESLLVQIATLACAVAAVHAYFGRRPAVLRAYRSALSGLPALLASDAAAFGVALALGAVCVPAAIVALLLLAGLAAVSGGFAFFSAAAAAIGVGLVSVVAAVVNFAGLMMLASIAAGDEAPLRSGLRRTFGAGLWPRTVAAAAIVVAVLSGSWLIGAVAGDGLTALTHNTAGAALLQSLTGIGSSALIACFVVVYAFDVRVRREGLDLAVAAGEAVGDFPRPHPNASPT